MALSREEAIAIAWRHGRLSHRLDKNQRGMYEAYRKSKSPKFVFDVARRVGKSTIMVMVALEDCLRRPKATVKFGAATQDMVREIIMPIVDWFTEECPKDLQPKWVQHDSSFIFTNGSRLKLVGLDLHPDRLRGTATDTALIDEAGFVDELEYVVQSILVPQMQGRPHARILMGSTPPVSPAHKWTTRYVPEAIANAAYIHRTIEDNPRLSANERAFFINEAGGPDAPENLRENYAKHVVDEERVIVPEFAKHEDSIIEEFSPPRYFDGYVSMDPGFTDLTSILFAYYDFEKDVIFVQDELALVRSNTDEVATQIKLKEAELWRQFPRKDGRPQPFCRYSDIDLRLIADLNSSHQLTFIPIDQMNLRASVNSIRVAIAQHRIRIHPRCKTLIAHLKHGIWKKNYNLFERSGDFGHFDAIAALIYLVRNIKRGANPFPEYMHGENSRTHLMRRSAPRVSDTAKQLQGILSLKRAAPLRRFR